MEGEATFVAISSEWYAQRYLDLKDRVLHLMSPSAHPLGSLQKRHHPAAATEVVVVGPDDGGPALPSWEDYWLPYRKVITSLQRHRPKPAANSLWLPLVGGLPPGTLLRRMSGLFANNAVPAIIARILNCVAGAVYALGPLPGGGPSQEIVSQQTLDTAHGVLTTLFSLELFINVVARGLALPQGAYLREPWDVLSLIFLALAAGPNSARHCLAARPVLVLRPWRRHGSANASDVIDGAMRHCAISVIAVCAVAGAAAYVMAIAGMWMLGGQTHVCACGVPTSSLGRIACVGAGPVRTAPGGAFESSRPPFFGGFYGPCAWIPPRRSFDTVGDALLSVAGAASFRWNALVTAAAATQGKGNAPVAWSRGDTLLLPLTVVSVIGLAAAGCITGLVVQAAMTGSWELGVSDRELTMMWIEETAKRARPRKPRGFPQHGASRLARSLLRWRGYGLAVHSLAAANLLFLMLRSAQMDGTAAYVLEVQTHVFFAIIAVEVAIALVALGPGNFLAVPLNWLDLVVLVASAVGAMHSKP